MELITTEVILKSNIGVHDNLFGGEMMSYLDLAGFSYAAQKAKNMKMVTKKISEVIFHTTVKVNSIVKFYGETIRIGNTSLTIRLEARRLDVESEKEVLVCSAEVVFVKVNDYGEPSPLNLRQFDKKKVEEKVRNFFKPDFTKPMDFKILPTLTETEKLQEELKAAKEYISKLNKQKLG